SRIGVLGHVGSLGVAKPGLTAKPAHAGRLHRSALSIRVRPSASTKNSIRRGTVVASGVSALECFTTSWQDPIVRDVRGPSDPCSTSRCRSCVPFPSKGPSMTAKETSHEAERLAAYAAELRYEELPAAVVQRAKDCIIDGVATISYGAELPWSRMVI